MTVTIAPSARTARPVKDHALRIRRCSPGRPPELVSSEDVRTPGTGGVWWIDVDSTVDRTLLLETMHLLDPELEAGLVDELLSRDDLAKVDQAAGGPRNVSMVGVKALSTATGAGGRAGGHLVFQMIESLVGPGWIVTCWHRSESCTGGDPNRNDDPILRDELVEQAQRLWVETDLRTAGDLGTALAHAVAKRYKRVHRSLELWLQAWELDFHRSSAPPDPSALKHLMAMLNETRRRLAAFNNSRCLTDNEKWFPELSSDDLDLRADRYLDHSLKELRILFDNVRADLELVSMNEMAALAREAKLSGEAERRFERNLGRVTALLLVPTLITGFFGANTRLPGGGDWHGTEAMVGLMFVTSLVVYLVIVRRAEKDEARIDALGN